MKDHLINLGLTASLALLIWVVIAQHHQAQTNAAAAQRVEYVQTTCDKAHREYSGASEAACGEAQDATNTEYLCTAEPNASCWVEVK